MAHQPQFFRVRTPTENDHSLDQLLDGPSGVIDVRDLEDFL